MRLNDLALLSRTPRYMHPELVTRATTVSRKPIIEKFIEPLEELSARGGELIERWDGLAPTQAERSKESGRDEIEVELQTKLLDEFPENFKTKSLVLDFAAGAGSSTTLLRSICKVVALDISGEMIKEAANILAQQSRYARAIQYSIGGKLELWDMQPNPIKKESVDSIICHGAFHAILARGAARGEFDIQAAEIIFQRALALLKSGGIFSTEFLIPPKEGDLNPLTTAIDPIKFAQLLEITGFKIVKNVEEYSYTHPTAGDLYSQWIVAIKK